MALLRGARGICVVCGGVWCMVSVWCVVCGIERCCAVYIIRKEQGNLVGSKPYLPSQLAPAVWLLSHGIALSRAF